jgi:hypothetical protein
MPPARMIVNGLDLSAFNLWVEVPQGWADAPSRRDRLVDVQGAGQALIPQASKLGERQWTVEAVLICPSLAVAQAMWDQIKLYLANSLLEVTILPWTDRVGYCRYQDIRWQGQSLDLAGWRCSISFLSPSAYLVAPEIDSYGLAAGSANAELEMHLGTAPSPFVVEFIGPTAIGPTLTYTDAGGQVRGTVHLTTALAATEWLRFDSQLYTMERHNTIGLVSNAAPQLANDSRGFQLEPLDGSAHRGPTLALDQGSAIVYTRKAYL